MKYRRGSGLSIPEPTCRHVKGGGVICGEPETACSTCGWNPEVAKKRKEKIRAKIQGLPEERPEKVDEPLDVYATAVDINGKPIIVKNGSYYMTARSKDAAESIAAALNADVARKE